VVEIAQQFAEYYRRTEYAERLAFPFEKMWEMPTALRVTMLAHSSGTLKSQTNLGPISEVLVSGRVIREAIEQIAASGLYVSEARVREYAKRHLSGMGRSSLFKQALCEIKSEVGLPDNDLTR